MKKKSFDPNRRKFLDQGAKATLALGIGAGLIGLPSVSAFANQPRKSPKFLAQTGFAQTPLAYAYNALEPHIDAMTMEIHYSKHAAAYANNLKDAARDEKVDTSKPLEDLMKNISKYTAKMRNNGGGHYNHELFWKIMSPKGGGEPTGDLAKAIAADFGTFAAFKTKFEDAAKARFGSGWAWLSVDANKKLVVSSTPNQDNPLMDVADVKGTPILGLDVWEHAYYLKYQNRRPDYITAFWNLVDWNAVAERYKMAVK
jgi:Fe-Mn family superoxide dismutase